MLILGISCFYHDAAAALIEDGRVVFAAQEERFSRIKHDDSFPKNAIQACLDEAGIQIHQLDAIVFYEKPLLKFERILETFTSVAPKGLKSFLFALPKWINEKILFKSLLKKYLKAIGDIDYQKTPLLFTEHHISHAATAFYPTAYDDAAILVVDGVGEWATISISKAEKEKIEVLKEIHFPHSIGMLYSAFTYFLGFKVNSGEYKLMGLSPYGNRNSQLVQHFKDLIYKHLILSRGDKGFQLNMDYFTYEYRLKMIDDEKWRELFGIKTRQADDDITQEHCDLALAIQEVTEELMLDLVKLTKKLFPSKNLCLAGGVALNCVSNGKILQSGIFENIYVPSSPGDSGCAVGVALYAYHNYFEQSLNKEIAYQNRNAYLGNAIKDDELKILQRQFESSFQVVEEEKLFPLVAKYLSDAKVVGWVQGRMEFGPRALGNRSILALPSMPNMQSQLNLKIKYREDFRPFAPVLKAELAQKYFELPQNSNYMEFVVKLQENLRVPLPENFSELSPKEKLDTYRSDIQAVIHTDYSARPQTVSKETNLSLYRLLDEVEKLGHHPVLVNTSFNVRGEPIVSNALDAYACFMQTEMDVLVIGNYVFLKEEQPNLFVDKFKKRTFSKD